MMAILHPLKTSRLSGYILVRESIGKNVWVSGLYFCGPYTSHMGMDLFNIFSWRHITINFSSWPSPKKGHFSLFHCVAFTSETILIFTLKEHIYNNVLVSILSFQSKREKTHHICCSALWGNRLCTYSLVSSQAEVLNPGRTWWVVLFTYMGWKVFPHVSWTPGSCWNYHPHSPHSRGMWLAVM